MNGVKNATESTDIRLDYAEERICEIEDRSFVIMKSEENRMKIKKKESLCDLWITLERNNLYIIGVPGEQRYKGGRKYI